MNGLDATKLCSMKTERRICTSGHKGLLGMRAAGGPHPRTKSGEGRSRDLLPAVASVFADGLDVWVSLISWDTICCVFLFSLSALSHGNTSDEDPPSVPLYSCSNSTRTGGRALVVQV